MSMSMYSLVGIRADGCLVTILNGVSKPTAEKALSLIYPGSAYKEFRVEQEMPASAAQANPIPAKRKLGRRGWMKPR